MHGDVVDISWKDGAVRLVVSASVQFIPLRFGWSVYQGLHFEPQMIGDTSAAGSGLDSLPVTC